MSTSMTTVRAFAHVPAALALILTAACSDSSTAPAGPPERRAGPPERRVVEPVAEKGGNGGGNGGATVIGCTSGDCVDAGTIAAVRYYDVARNSSATNPDIVLLTQGGTFIRRLTTDAGTDMHPAISPDRSRVAFFSDVNGTGVYIVNIDGTGLHKVVSTGVTQGGLSWSQDNTRLVLAVGIGGNVDIHVVNVDGTGLTNLTNDAASDSDPVFTPDGSAVIYASTRWYPAPGKYSKDLYKCVIATKACSAITQTANEDEYAPTLSKNGLLMFLRRYLGQSNGKAVWYTDIITSTETGASRVTRYTTTATLASPSFAPNGFAMVFASDAGGYSLWRMDFSGSAPTRITSPSTDYIQPSWNN